MKVAIVSACEKHPEIGVILATKRSNEVACKSQKQKSPLGEEWAKLLILLGWLMGLEPPKGWYTGAYRGT